MNHEVKPLGRILLYLDGSESSLTAAKLGITIAKRYDCLLKAIYVVNESLLTELLGAKVLVKMEKMDYERSLEEDGKRYLNYVAKLAEKKGLKIETKLLKGIVHDIVAKEVIAYACDLLIQGELGEVLSLRDSFYEEGERILRKVDCPVLVVRGTQKVEKMYEDL